LVVLQGQRRALDLGDALLEDAAVAIRIEGVERATAAVFVKGKLGRGPQCWSTTGTR
jgi:hypothetical protein